MGIENQENCVRDSAVRALGLLGRKEKLNMAKDLAGRTSSTAAPKQAEDARSRLKRDLMEDALGRMFGEEVEKTAPGTPRVILALANHAQTASWDRAKLLQRRMFKA